jgi:hypothetical protein
MAIWADTGAALIRTMARTCRVTDWRWSTACVVRGRLRHMTDKPGQPDLMLAVAMAWGIWSGTTDSELDEIASQLLTSLTELRDELPNAPVPDILGIDEDLADRKGWRREITIHRDGARAATDLVQVISTRPGEWPETMRHILVSHTRRHGRPILVAMVDSLTRLAAPALSVIAHEHGQQLPELLEESLPWLQPRRR